MKMSVRNFNLETTLESGQVFGFRKDSSGAFEGRLAGSVFRLRQAGDWLHAQSDLNGRTRDVLSQYFDLNRDLTPLYQIIDDDAALKPSLRACAGLRLIRQDAWEALACFIISSNNNVKRIQHIWRNLASYFGRESGAFPSALQIARSHERVLRSLGLGYRAPYLWASARFVASCPESLVAIRELEYEAARERVSAFPGIGPKVADCVLLYGFQKYEAFPVDVWIHRVMRQLYFKNRSVSPDRMIRFARRRWGPWTGYVQQYLFHGGRTGVLGSP